MLTNLSSTLSTRYSHQLRHKNFNQYIILLKVGMISSMLLAVLRWISDKVSENIAMYVGDELPLSDCCMRVGVKENNSNNMQPFI